MKLYKTTITPESNFATTLKGDTLFGQLCWAIRYALGEERLEALLQSYSDRPFLVISDAFPEGYLPKPKMPSALLGEDSDLKKENRKKIWLTLPELQNGDFAKAQSDEEIQNSDENIVTIRNSINYKTFTTDDTGIFTPYGEQEFSLGKKDIYFLLDESQLRLEELQKSFKQLSQSGYGKDTTIGKGRFGFEDFKEVPLDNSSTTYLTLSPFSPAGMDVENIYYEPFTRFGKFGGNRAFKNAFKKPILMADTASVAHFKETKTLQYIGKAITKISDRHADAVHQGYSIVIPIRTLHERI